MKRAWIKKVIWDEDDITYEVVFSEPFSYEEYKEIIWDFVENHVPKF